MWISLSSGTNTKNPKLHVVPECQRSCRATKLISFHKKEDDMIKIIQEKYSLKTVTNWCCATSLLNAICQPTNMYHSHVDYDDRIISKCEYLLNTSSPKAATYRRIPVQLFYNSTVARHWLILRGSTNHKFPILHKSTFTLEIQPWPCYISASCCYW